MSPITSAGATPSANSSAVVETLASIDTLIATIAASDTIQPPTMNDLKPVLGMTTTLLRVDPVVTATLGAEVGLSARTRKEGALLERWRAQSGMTAPTIQDPHLLA